jgi:Kef-type K+ transport system membrane component KefB
MFLIFLIGIILTYSSWNIDAQLDSKNCTDVNLKKSNKGVFVIGIICITSAVSFLICNLSNSNSSNKSLNVNINFYALFILTLGIILMILGSIISSKSVNVCSNSKSFTTPIWLLGVLMILFSVTYLVVPYKSNPIAVGASFKF